MKTRALIVEIGNSVTELAVFENSSRSASLKAATAGFSDVRCVDRVLSGLFSECHGITDAAVCSVVPALTDLFLSRLAGRLSGSVLEISCALSLPFTLDYRPPEAFGADRLALCAHVRHSWPKEAVIALDIGTAMTCDVVSSSGDYLGGMILPGIDLMTSALHDRTAKLPKVDISGPAPILGRSTEECIRSGVFWGAVKQAEGLVSVVRRFLVKEQGVTSFRVLATGGSCRLIASAMEDPPEIDEDAVLNGARVLMEMNMGKC
ncbi:hypothetical protein CHL67_03685 [Prosthecochloris sp. GSB1]|uniref:type III pantothenate kinase n=1 Tax=Prosthecochloris sp. GSB1 TaxID=281093 RepID=UPI000B8CADD4|nr:type III pantothenate kinase [Prosthecochloris sp. GSB1]ASQ90149.1 hypothetical protein CHL67_03685 [Prosthecochloris sp. GSB1]